MVIKSDLHPRSFVTPPYPTSDGPIVNLTWDTANPGWCGADVDWHIEDEFNVYIMRTTAANNTITTARSKSLYKYNLLSKSLTKLCNVAGTYSGGTSGEPGFLVGRGFFRVNLTYSYCVFAENTTIYVADMNTGVVLGSYNQGQKLGCAELVWHPNKKDFYLFYSFAVNTAQLPRYQAFIFDTNSRILSVSAFQTISFASNSDNTWNIYPIAPNSLTLGYGQVFVIVMGATATGGVGYVGLNIFDIVSGTFVQNTGQTQIWSGAVGGSYSNPANVGRHFIYDNNINKIIPSTYLTIAGQNSNFFYYNYNFSGLTLNSATTQNWQTGAPATYGGVSQRFDKKFFAVWGTNNTVWFQRGTPVLGGWSNIGTTPFSTNNYYGGNTFVTVGTYGNPLLFTTSGLFIVGVYSNTTTAAPVAFFPLMNSGG